MSLTYYCTEYYIPGTYILIHIIIIVQVVVNKTSNIITPYLSILPGASHVGGSLEGNILSCVFWAPLTCFPLCFGGHLLPGLPGKTAKHHELKQTHSCSSSYYLWHRVYMPYSYSYILLRIMTTPLTYCYYCFVRIQKYKALCMKQGNLPRMTFVFGNGIVMRTVYSIQLPKFRVSIQISACHSYCSLFCQASCNTIPPPPTPPTYEYVCAYAGHDSAVYRMIQPNIHSPVNSNTTKSSLSESARKSTGH